MNESNQGTSVLRQRMIEDMRMRKPLTKDPSQDSVDTSASSPH
jgi:hypothetical protein